MAKKAVVIHVRSRRRVINGGTKNMVDTVKSNAAAISYNFARNVEAGAKRRVHVISGNLRRSIYRQKVGVGHHKVIVGAYYGIYEEFGTRYRPPHPFFKPAFVAAKAQYNRDKMKVFRR